MTGVEENEEEYESDPEETKLSLKMRRREASDDEDEDADEGVGRGSEGRLRRDKFDSDGELEEGGAPGEYYDEHEVEDEYLEAEDELVYDDEDGGGGEVPVTVVPEGEGRVELTEIDEIEKIGGNEKGDDNIDNKPEMENEEEEKKENEPFAVPTAGAFYMHDDRFRENLGGRNRHTLGGRKLWESKDDRKWGHDKYEELTVQERQYDEGKRSSRGRRGRGRGRGSGYSGGNINKPKNYENEPKIVKGRGAKRYQPSKNNGAPITQDKQSGKVVEKVLNTNGERVSSSSNGQSDLVSTKKQVFASSLNYASPPFYPSNKESGVIIKNAPPRNLQANTMMQGKSSVDSIGMNNLYIDNSSSSINSVQSQHLRGQGQGQGQLQGQGQGRGRGLNSLPVSSYPANNFNYVPKNSGQSQSQGQHYVQVSGMPKGNSVESRELVTSSESSKLRNGKGNVQGSGRGSSFVYSGTHFMGSPGNMGADQSNPGGPTFLPVMQFPGQHHHPGGIPAVGMAFPGYVGPPQLGIGNSEMKWLPLLAGAASALGAAYCSPYLPIHPSSSKENNTKTGTEWKPSSQRPELANDELVQRQKNPRRYTEMKFDQ